MSTDAYSGSPETWEISFGEELWPFFAGITRYREGESDEEYENIERQRRKASELAFFETKDSAKKLLLGFRALLSTGMWRQVNWNDDQSFPWSEEPDFLHQVLEVIVEELETRLGNELAPQQSRVRITSGGGVISAPIKAKEGLE